MPTPRPLALVHYWHVQFDATNESAGFSMMDILVRRVVGQECPNYKLSVKTQNIGELKADHRSNHFLMVWIVVARPARAMDVVSGISFGQTATQF